MQKKVQSFQGILILACIGVSLLGCSNSESQPSGKKFTKAKVTLKPTKGNEVKGTVTFTENEDGVLVVADVEGLKLGKHGFHIHENGDCSAPDGSSAGDHYNPKNALHGGPESSERHVGDLGNIVADDKGHGHYERTDKMITLTGEETIIGRSVVIHADEDDFKSQPAGNSGLKIACGTIEEVHK